jgi:hypothetical protein
MVIALLGVVGIILSAMLSYGLGRRAERLRQLVAVRVGLLERLMVWLKGAERMVGILGDTIVSISQGMPAPMMYDMSKRRDAANFMSENTNEVLGILQSKSFNVGKARKLAKELDGIVQSIDRLVKYELLPREVEIVGRANAKTLTEAYLMEALALKVRIDDLLQQAYSTIAKVKTALD